MAALRFLSLAISKIMANGISDSTTSKTIAHDGAVLMMSSP